MSLLVDYRTAQHDETVARLRRLLALRAMVADGTSQRDVAEALGVSQPAVSKQLSAHRDLDAAHPETLIQAAAPVLVRVAADHGFTRLAVFGSVARGEARHDSDVDLLVDAPDDTTISGLENLRRTFERVLGRPVDLVTYGGLDPRRDADILREAVPL